MECSKTTYMIPLFAKVCFPVHPGGVHRQSWPQIQYYVERAGLWGLNSRKTLRYPSVIKRGSEISLRNGGVKRTIPISRGDVPLLRLIPRA